MASIVQALTFSGTINTSLDKIGKIDPSTSTVLIGMLLGNTFGFLLDLMLASDEGLREYLWSPPKGMQCAHAPRRRPDATPAAALPSSSLLGRRQTRSARSRRSASAASS